MTTWPLPTIEPTHAPVIRWFTGDARKDTEASATSTAQARTAAS